MSLGVSKVSFSGVSNVNNTTQTDGVKISETVIMPIKGFRQIR